MESNNPLSFTPTEDPHPVEIIEEIIPNSDGELNIKKYAKGKILGKGGFGTCFQFEDLETKKVFAAKIIKKSSLKKPRIQERLRQEIQIHKSLNSQHIVKFEHSFEDEENIYILMELCSNQSLSVLIKKRKRLTELEVRCYLAQIVKALMYLHCNKIIHRGIKLGDLLINDKMKLKLADFGFATKLENHNERRKTLIGAPGYMAPEIWEGKEYSHEVDIFSLGVIIYILLIGRNPFEPLSRDPHRIIYLKDYSFPEDIPLSETSKDLISKMLEKDPTKRITLDEIMDHPFMKNGTFPKVLPESTLTSAPSESYLKQFLPCE